MKIKQILTFSLAAIASAFVLNSCGPDEEKVNLAPVIDLVAEAGSVTGDVSLPGDQNFTVIMSISDDVKVNTVEVTSSIAGRISVQLDTTINGISTRIKLVRKTFAAKASEIWTISATDDKGVSSSKKFTITTTTDVTPGAALTTYTKGTDGLDFRVWNVHGIQPGAFDLEDGVARLKNDDDKEKDLNDSTTISEISQWPARWSTGKSGSRYKKVGGSYTFDNITNEGQLDAAWNASGSEIRFMKPKKGDLYIALLPRVGGKKVLVSITDVVTTSVDNNDFIQFVFKKK